MIKKILWATDGSEDSFASLKYAEILAKNCNAAIHGIAVLTSESLPYNNALSEKEKKSQSQILEKNKAKILEKLEKIKKNLDKKNLQFTYTITKGTASNKIVETAQQEDVNLIAMGKSHSAYNFILGGTLIRVLRNCTIPILTARENGPETRIKRILVPLDLSHGLTAGSDYAYKLSQIFNADIYLVHIIETAEHNFTSDIIEKIKSNTKKEMGYLLGKSNLDDSVRIGVEVAKNAWVGITELVRKNDFDLIVMMTYEGIIVKKEFIGSTTWKVIQKSEVPVITLSPNKYIMKMTGDAK